MPAEAVLAALDALSKLLAALGVRFALLGGLALAIWRHPRFTKDVDILVALEDLPVSELIEALRPAGFRPKRTDGLIRLGELQMLQLIYAPPDFLVEVHVDLLLARSKYQQEALARRVPMTLPDFESPVGVLSCEDLILHKLEAGRIIDRADAAALLRANRESLDFGYLLRWVQDLKLMSAFSEIWAEAFPGQPTPEARS